MTVMECIYDVPMENAEIVFDPSGAWAPTSKNPLCRHHNTLLRWNVLIRRSRNAAIFPGVEREGCFCSDFALSDERLQCKKVVVVGWKYRRVASFIIRCLDSSMMTS